ncbi:BatD family protein [Microbulbifer sp. 2205BS26-8]|uniref:BatD family protein n=1 Tax=Microbulbifer sp. 2205BS26-8 TaxID=3064386 RepID=UPI00273F2344|nr:BatD family protein [Microbulbifer sp. 2205BS26-8]MDP5208644.1 BatD family protein [Microbulbifer sp. 2205BS26-8]
MCFIFVLLGLATITRASELNASVDRDKIAIDETFNLRLRYSGDESGGQPDFELLEIDFDILSRQQSNQYRVINGRAESFVEWTLSLAPKREGELMIPSLHYKDQVSNAIPIAVSEPQSRPEDGERKVFLEVELDKSKVYVQEQLLVDVRLYTTIGLHDIATQPLQVTGAHVEKVNEQRYERKLNGTSYAVYELTYAVFADSSGQLTIPALAYAAVAGRRDPFSLFNRNSQRLRLRSLAKTVEVLPKPDRYSGAHWLPATSLGIVQSWSQDTDTFAVGEPITRILTVRGEGLRAAQLPPLPKLDVEGLKTYPDQPQQEDQTGPDGVTGSRIETTAIVATRPGSYQLPAITLTWWDTKNHRQRATQLPAFRFNVSGSAAPATPSQEAGTLQTLVPGTPSLEVQDHFWRNLAIAALASNLLWLLYFYHLRRQHIRAKGQAVPKNPRPHKSYGSSAVKRAVDSGNPRHIQQAILNWLHTRWPQVESTTLADAARQLGFEELDELQELLGAALYQQPPRPLPMGKIQGLVERLMDRRAGHNGETEEAEALPKLFG